MSNIIGAETPKKEEPQQRQNIDDVYIGVFFDGTSTNMMNDVYYRSKVLHQEKQGKSAEILRGIDSAEDIKMGHLCKIEEEKGRESGFTNVAILYSLFTDENLKESNSSKCVVSKRIYIEGAGATDSTNSSFLNLNADGLAFGKGSTGVVGLTSKAVKEVIRYIDTLKSCFERMATGEKKLPNLHFYVFGFSRGSACARLFCHLLTRNKDSKLRYENDFSKRYGAQTLVKNGRLDFLEEYKTSGKITVEFLGIYDTVASIGCLKRKDGSASTDGLGIWDRMRVGALVGGARGALGGGDCGELVGNQVGTSEDVDSVASVAGFAGAVAGMAGGFVAGIAGGVVGIAGEVVRRTGRSVGKAGGVFGKAGGVLEETGGVVGKGGIIENVLPEWHYNNVDDYGLYIDTSIKSVCHICAMDEFRENFALTNIGKKVPSNAVEIMIPGCHSDVGGSFLDKAEESVKIKRPRRMLYDDQGKVVHDNRGLVVYRDYGICLKPSNVKPELDSKHEKQVDCLNESSLQSVGWIELEKDKLEKDNGDIKITRHNIKRGYSDIPLAMMMDYFKKSNVSIFGPIPCQHQYSSYKGLKDIGRGMVTTVGNMGNGNRYWLVPSDDRYKPLRLKYLHFSADDTPVAHLIPTVNSPGYNGDNVMCRMTYHGDKGEQKSAVDGVHFLYELSGIIRHIS